MKRFSLLLLMLSLIVVACTTAEPENPPTPTPGVTIRVIDEVIERGFEDGMHIATTTGMVADLVAVIGGEHVRVSQLIGVNVDPHTATLNEEATTVLNEAELVFYNGLGLEAGMLDELEAADGVAVGDSLLGRESSNGIVLIITDDEGDPDPHIWLDPRVWIQAGEIVRDTLIEVDGENADDYNANYDAYFEELRTLDSDIRTQINQLPSANRLLIVPHNAFKYFEREFGIIAREVTDENLDDIVAQIVRISLPAIFPLTTHDNEILNRVVDAVEAEGGTVRIAALPLHAESLMAPGEYGDIYTNALRQISQQLFGNLSGGAID